MIANLKKLLSSQVMYADGIYNAIEICSPDQATEIEMRDRVAARKYNNYLETIAEHHSISVMDHEVDLFLGQIPQYGLILDIGGCWGWHWRRLAETRPDVGVLIIDFVRSNLPHARNLLGDLVGSQVALMHADATALPILLDDDFRGFDGVWTVQTFQHIPTYAKAVSEAFRVLKRGGLFVNYSLNVQASVRSIKRILGKEYHTSGWVEGSFFLARATLEQKQQIEAIFNSKVRQRWSEIIFSPELHFSASGREGNWLGKLDALLSNDVGFFRWIARQHSYHCKKP